MLALTVPTVIQSTVLGPGRKISKTCPLVLEEIRVQWQKLHK